MLTPSYSELMQKINTNKLEETKITSRYTIVLAVAKRARQIIDKSNANTRTVNDRAISIAVKEMNEGKIKVNIEKSLVDSNYERMLTSSTKFKNVVTSSDDLEEGLKENYAPVIYETDTDDEIDTGLNFGSGFSELTEEELMAKEAAADFEDIDEVEM
ncbi:MAG: DNA-directed RNA polymerase subunit omega [Turicibacter sp.]|nr:DNA-directed RNA polymerase subunit omega [Turicibacter sp.]